MAISVSIDSQGATAAANRLNAIAAGLKQEMGSALREGANVFKTEAAGQAPVDTGYLRSHITITDSSSTEATVVSEAEYSGFVEFGTSRMSSQPYFVPAIQNTQNRIRDIIVKAISPSS